jgi:hypothetical protein
MVTGGKRVFIYGHFLDRAEKQRKLPPPPSLPSTAVEILREFSAVELIGKVYALTPGRNWQPVTPEGVRNYEWFTAYRRIVQHKPTTQNRMYFETQEGDYWEVLFFRQESDDLGQYIAVGLRYEHAKPQGSLKDLT